MTLSTAVPTAGWFPDPGDPSRERWWSGDAWTEHHRMAGEAARPRLEEPVAEQAQPEYVFEMTPAQPEPVAPEPVPVPAATALPEPVPTAAEPAPAARRLPTFEELLAAAAAPEAADEVLEEPAPQEWMPKAYGAPADEIVPAAPEAAALPAVPAVPAVPAFEAAPLPVFTPEPSIPPAQAVEPSLPAASLPPVPQLPAVPVVPVVPAAPVLAEPAPALAPPAAPVLAPAFEMPQPAVAPAPAPAPAPAFEMPQPMPTPAPAGFVQPTHPGLVMPSAPAVERAPRAEAARHAEMVEEVAPPAPSAPPPPPPVGYTASADPAIANRYRQALHNPEPAVEEADPLGAYPTALSVPTAPAPNQPGWGGMPLPGPGGAVAPGFGPAVPGTYAPQPATGSNKVAWSALSSAAIALGLTLLGIFVTDRIGLWPALLSGAAIVQGIVGAVTAHRVRKGGFAAGAAIVVGVGTLVLMGVTLFSWVTNPEYYMPGAQMEQEIVAGAGEYGYEIISADCPAEPSGTAGTHFDCTAYDAEGTAYSVDVLIDQDGYFVWEILDPAATS